MDALIGKIEKAKPFFEKVSRNKYLKAIRDGFMSAMPVVLFSSIFMLLAYVPNIFGFYWPSDIEAMILKPYNYSMGLLAVLVAGTTAKNLCDSLNRDMPVNRQINNISTLMAGIVGFLVVGVLKEILQFICQKKYHQIFHKHLQMLFLSEFQSYY